MYKFILLGAAVAVMAALSTPAYTADGSTTPTVEEVKAAFTGAVRMNKTRRGADRKATYKPGGKIVFEANGRTRERTWWVDPDSSLCNETSQGETCFKTVKEGNLIYLVRNGEKSKKGWPIKK